MALQRFYPQSYANKLLHTQSCKYRYSLEKKRVRENIFCDITCGSIGTPQSTPLDSSMLESLC
ncbi:hypothetical protein [Helicobacter sp.]|uniref:hypothetical protein n=1 Tax=Helicobacter sp. TaxID=218 RepID=UPI00388D22CE